MNLFDRNWWSELMERLQVPYRLIIRNDETLEERASFRLSMLNVYVLLSTVVVIVAASVILLIAYTPVKRYIPGYGSGGDAGREIVRLKREMNRLENELEAQEEYMDNIRKVLVGDLETLEDVQAPKLSKDTEKAASEVKPSEADRQVRQEAELDRLGNIMQQDRAKGFSGEGRSLEQLFFVPPVRGEVSSVFAQDKTHYGIDIVAPRNTAVKATMDGYVFFSDWTLETGNTIGIQHDFNVISFYKHNAQLLKKAGNYVRAGEAIAIIGNTGTQSSGPHLHFEIWNRGKAVDPADYVMF